MDMSEQATAGKFPASWLVSQDYDPKDNMLNLKGREYLNVQNRLIWFIKDQRNFIATGLARMPYVIRTEQVELDRQAGYAAFRTYVRDVLGNEATMYGSESAKDFPDYAEKASTKSLGRALLALGYGTASAQEMDEGERVVDSPVARKSQQPPPKPTPSPRQEPQDYAYRIEDNRPSQERPTQAQPQQQARYEQAVSIAQVFERAKRLGKDGAAWATLKRECGADVARIIAKLDEMEAGAPVSAPDPVAESVPAY